MTTMVSTFGVMSSEAEDESKSLATSRRSLEHKISEGIQADR